MIPPPDLNDGFLPPPFFIFLYLLFFIFFFHNGGIERGIASSHARRGAVASERAARWVDLLSRGTFVCEKEAAPSTPRNRVAGWCLRSITSTPFAEVSHLKSGQACCSPSAPGADPTTARPPTTTAGVEEPQHPLRNLTISNHWGPPA